MPEKNLDFKDTTSLKWKRDFIEFFMDKNLENCLEIGTHRGYSTTMLSKLFKHVWTVEFNESRMNDAMKVNENNDNITFIQADAYNPMTFSYMPKEMDVIFIDCVHTHEAVIYDIQTALRMARTGSTVYLVFDDYGHSESRGVNSAVNQAIQGGLTLEKYIGEDPGFVVNRTNGTNFSLIDREGIILSFTK